MTTTTLNFHGHIRRLSPAGAPAWIRQVTRSAGFCGILLLACAELGALCIRGQGRQPRSRALWLQRMCRRLVRLLDLRAQHIGEPARTGLLVCNHVSYLDIITLSANHPLIFVAKKEVRSWPVIGWLAAAAGTIFLDRGHRGEVARVTGEMKRLLAAGIPVCIFPEGTSSDGSRVLPFHSSLFEPAISQSHAVTAGWVGYALDDGAAETEACYWGDLTFGPHLLNLFSKRCVHATVAYADAGPAAGSRKEFGHRLHALVCALAKSRA